MDQIRDTPTSTHFWFAVAGPTAWNQLPALHWWWRHASRYRAYTRGDRLGDRSQRSSRRRSPVGCSIKQAIVAATIACVSTRGDRRYTQAIVAATIAPTVEATIAPCISPVTQNKQVLCIIHGFKLILHKLSTFNHSLTYKVSLIYNNPLGLFRILQDSSTYYER